MGAAVKMKVPPVSACCDFCGRFPGTVGDATQNVLVGCLFHQGLDEHVWPTLCALHRTWGVADPGCSVTPGPRSLLGTLGGAQAAALGPGLLSPGTGSVCVT